MVLAIHHSPLQLLNYRSKRIERSVQSKRSHRQREQLGKPVEGGARDASEEQDLLRSRGSSRSRDREVALTVPYVRLARMLTLTARVCVRHPSYPPPPSNAAAPILR